MPKLVIDDQEIEVPQGTKVIDAAEQLGIVIPRFCYHPALGSVGACRVCAVKLLEGPVKGIQMSCMIDAKDDMVVSTTDPEAVDFRRHVIEWLMLHHPHDCPVCDEGGHCLLQDLTVSGNHSIRRYKGPKRTHIDQDLGPLVAHEMNRCIQCYRCSRYYQEFTGYRDLGVTGIANRVYFGRQEPGTLESPFAGNLIDICPTGVYTDKPSRYKGRRWDFQRTPSFCIHCGLGCHTTTLARYREVVRMEAAYSADINGHFLCDRGRYGYAYANRPDRPRVGLVDGKRTSSAEAVQAATDRLAGMKPESVAVIGSARSGMDTLATLTAAVRDKGWKGPALFPTETEAATVQNALAAWTPETALTLRELEKVDFALIIGADPLSEAPMSAMALRQAVRAGATVAVIDPRPVELPFDFHHLPVLPEMAGAAVAALLQSAIDLPSDAALPEAADLPESLQTLIGPVADALQNSNRPAVLCGTDLAGPDLPTVAAETVRLLRAAGKHAGLSLLLPAANAFGAGLIDAEPSSWETVLEAVEGGTIKALVVAEADLFERFPDRKRLEAALGKLELLVVMDYVASPAVERADVFIPSLSLFETGGLFINSEGRAQFTPAAYAGGIPIRETGGGDHPPREFRKDIPGGDVPATSEAFARIAGLAPGTVIPAVHPALDGIAERCVADVDGVRLDAIGLKSVEGEPAEIPGDGDFLLLAADAVFGTEPLSSRSLPVQKRTAKPVLKLHPDDAATLGLSTGDRVTLDTGNGAVRLAVAPDERTAPGVLTLPRHYELPWQRLGGTRRRLRKDQIRKEDR
jgi:NADH-quinone oxidoreductase subunit G